LSDAGSSADLFPSARTLVERVWTTPWPDAFARTVRLDFRLFSNFGGSSSDEDESSEEDGSFPGDAYIEIDVD
jgi:hypothetical protein